MPSTVFDATMPPPLILSRVPATPAAPAGRPSKPLGPPVPLFSSSKAPRRRASFQYYGSDGGRKYTNFIKDVRKGITRVNPPWERGPKRNQELDTAVPLNQNTSVSLPSITTRQGAESSLRSPPTPNFEFLLACIHPTLPPSRPIIFPAAKPILELEDKNDCIQHLWKGLSGITFERRERWQGMREKWGEVETSDVHDSEKIGVMQERGKEMGVKKWKGTKVGSARLTGKAVHTTINLPITKINTLMPMRKRKPTTIDQLSPPIPTAKSKIETQTKIPTKSPSPQLVKTPIRSSTLLASEHRYKASCAIFRVEKRKFETAEHEWSVAQAVMERESKIAREIWEKYEDGSSTSTFMLEDFGTVIASPKELGDEESKKVVGCAGMRIGGTSALDVNSEPFSTSLSPVRNPQFATPSKTLFVSASTDTSVISTLPETPTTTTKVPSTYTVHCPPSYAKTHHITSNRSSKQVSASTSTPISTGIRSSLSYIPGGQSDELKTRTVGNSMLEECSQQTVKSQQTQWNAVKTFNLKTMKGGSDTENESKDGVWSLREMFAMHSSGFRDQNGGEVDLASGLRSSMSYKTFSQQQTPHAKYGHSSALTLAVKGQHQSPSSSKLTATIPLSTGPSRSPRNTGPPPSAEMRDLGLDIYPNKNNEEGMKQSEKEKKEKNEREWGDEEGWEVADDLTRLNSGPRRGPSIWTVSGMTKGMNRTSR